MKISSKAQTTIEINVINKPMDFNFCFVFSNFNSKSYISLIVLY